MRALFLEKQQQIREQITQLQVIENDLTEALAYLDSCQTCSTDYAPTECGDCDHHGPSQGRGASAVCRARRSADLRRDDDKAFDVPVTVLFREGNN